MTTCEECEAPREDTYFRNMVGSGGLRRWLCDQCFIEQVQGV